MRAAIHTASLQGLDTGCSLGPVIVSATQNELKANEACRAAWDLHGASFVPQPSSICARSGPKTPKIRTRLGQCMLLCRYAVLGIGSYGKSAHALTVASDNQPRRSWFCILQAGKTSGQALQRGTSHAAGALCLCKLHVWHVPDYLTVLLPLCCRNTQDNMRVLLPICCRHVKTATRQGPRRGASSAAGVLHPHQLHGCMQTASQLASEPRRGEVCRLLGSAGPAAIPRPCQPLITPQAAGSVHCLHENHA